MLLKREELVGDDEIFYGSNFSPIKCYLTTDDKKL
jgi:hypothetical protein